MKSIFALIALLAATVSVASAQQYTLPLPICIIRGVPVLGICPSPSPTPSPTPSPVPTPTPSPTPSPTPVPTPIPTPVPTPIPTATPVGVVSWANCKWGAPGDGLNADITNAPLDPNSAAMLHNTDAVERESFYAAVRLEAVNIATNATPTIKAVPSGRGPTSVQYAPGFLFEAVPPNPISQGGDSHYMVLNTDTCMYTELYAASFANGVMSYYDGNTESSAKVNTGRVGTPESPGMTLPNWYTTAGGQDILPYAMKYEEVLAGGAHHFLLMSLNVGNISSTTYVWPGGPQKASLYRGVLPSLAYGSHLRLKPSYVDSTATPECNAVLVTLKRNGAVVNDQSSNGVGHAIYFVNGLNDPRGDLWGRMNFGCLGNLHLENFDVIAPTPRP